MRTTFIYALSHPTTKEIRYIGKSNTPYRRFNGHLNDNSSCRKARWVQLLKQSKLVPVLEIIDEVFHNEWEFWERHYICLYKSWGFNLTNLKLGGAGGVGKPTSEETKEKQRQAKLGKKLSESAKEKLRIFNTGKKQPLEAVAKTATANRGRKNTQEMKDLMRTRLQGRKRDIRAVVMMAETNKVAVLQYSLSGDFIAEYPSLKDAKLAISPNNNGLCCHLKGKRKSWCGYKFKYK